MTVPTSPTYSTAAQVAAQTAFAALLDAGTAGSLKLRDAAGVLLMQVLLTDPCGSVNSSTGQLTLTPAASGLAAADGTVAYGEFCDSAGVVHLALPAQAGSVPVSGFIVLNALTLVAGTSVAVVSATIG